ncbi:MAG: MoaD/ThiS family protein [Bacillota bacterium]
MQKFPAGVIGARRNNPAIRGEDVLLEVRVFGGLEKKIPGASFGKPMAVEADAGSTVGDLLQLLKIPADQVSTILVNGVHYNKEDLLKPGDRVAFFPPVGGG